MQNLPTDLLRTFVTVAELKGFTRAGQVLGRSQPAVSLQVQRLEEIVGAPLLVRNGRTLELSERGQTLLEYARQMLQLNDEAMALLARSREAESIKIGIPNDYAASYLPRILRSFPDDGKGLSLQVDCDISDRVLNRLEAGEFDLAVALRGDRQSPEACKVWRERMIWVGQPEVVQNLPDSIPLVVYTEGCIYRRNIIQALNQAGKPWHVVYCSDSLSGLKAAIEAGIGISSLSEQTAHEGMPILDETTGLPPLPQVEVGLHYRKDRPSSGVLKLVEHITSYLDDQPGSVPV